MPQIRDITDTERRVTATRHKERYGHDLSLLQDQADFVAEQRCDLSSSRRRERIKP